MNLTTRKHATPRELQSPMARSTVLVTGSTGGIGKATALGLAAMGAPSDHRSEPGAHRGRGSRDPCDWRRGECVRRGPVLPVGGAAAG
jgi:hypothetical protein